MPEGLWELVSVRKERQFYWDGSQASGVFGETDEAQRVFERAFFEVVSFTYCGRAQSVFDGLSGFHAESELTGVIWRYIAYYRAVRSVLLYKGIAGFQ